MIDLEKLDVEAPTGAFSTFDAAILVPAVEGIPEGGVYLEVGVDQGKSLYIARQVAKKSVKVYGVDLREDPKVKGAVFLRGDSTTMPWDKTIDVLFIDGDHTYKGCKADIENFAPFVKEGGTMLFHDADEGGPGVLRAITEYIDNNVRPVRRWILHKTPKLNTSIVSVELA